MKKQVVMLGILALMAVFASRPTLAEAPAPAPAIDLSAVEGLDAMDPCGGCHGWWCWY